jgi:hypothetical protein
MSQLSPWIGIAVLGLAVAFFFWQRRAMPPRSSSTPLDPHLALQHEILRGVLRKEGLLPPAPPSKVQDVIELPLRYRLVPLPPADPQENP